MIARERLMLALAEALTDAELDAMRAATEAVKVARDAKKAAREAGGPIRRASGTIEAVHKKAKTG